MPEKMIEHISLLTQTEKMDTKVKEIDELSQLTFRSPKVAILGFGNYGKALAESFYNAGMQVTIGTSQYASHDVFSMMTYAKAIKENDVIFLTIPAHAHNSVVPDLSSLLGGKTIVDVSNLDKSTDTSNAVRLQNMIPNGNVVKALNTISAYTLEQLSYGASRDTFVYGNNKTSKDIVIDLLQGIGLNPIDKGLLHLAIVSEKQPFRFFPGWGTAWSITIATLMPILLYTYLRFFWYNSEKEIEKNKNDLGLYHANRVIAWTMFWVLGLVYLPGILAGFIQIYRGTKYSRFPNWLDTWMKCRKQLGLICLLLACIHGCASCLLIGGGELKHMVDNQYIKQPNGPPVVLYQLINAKNQWSLLFACLSLALMTIAGITSLPSVNAGMSWMEWDFVQRGLGFTSLVFGFIHVMVYVVNLWDPDYKYGWKMWKLNPKGNFPPGAFVMPMLPLLVIVLKIILMFPGLSCYLNRIRKGISGYRSSAISRQNKIEQA